MDTLLAPGARVLISALTYDQSEMSGPPHSLSVEQITELYHGLPNGKERYTIEVIGNPQWETKGTPGFPSLLKSDGGKLSQLMNISVIVNKKY